MNEATALGLALTAAMDRRVIVLAPSQLRAHSLFMAVERAVMTDPAFGQALGRIATVRRANGREQIRFQSGGAIFFLSERSKGHRGLAADVLYLDEGITSATDVYPCLSTSTDGRIIRH